MQKIGIIGAGTMGHGIAQVCAMHGHPVAMYDTQHNKVQQARAQIYENLEKGVQRGKVEPSTLDKTLTLIRGTMSLQQVAADAWLVVEAVPERLDLKRNILAQVAAEAPSGCILASNTSSLSIDAIAAELPHPERVVGTHFFNPVHIMKLLEVISGSATSPEVLQTVIDWGTSLGKQVISVRDAPGFATSRLGVCLGMEAVRMLEQGVASAEDIDTAMVLGYRHPIGPLKLTDLVGLDVRAAIGSYLAEQLNDPSFEPPELMREMIARGELGKKSGKGFYDW